MLGLYLHIPFCQAICSYCNFNRGLLDVELKRRYLVALEREIRESSEAGTPVDTIFFGGGTPSLLEPDEIAQLLTACRDTYPMTADVEITLETNPETVTAERLAAFRDAGINRLSFGVQSFDDAELKRLGRIHTAQRAIDAIQAAKGTGFNSVSFDLMLWLPEQTKESWLGTLETAIAQSPDHLSLYLLELYPNAPLKEEMARAKWSQSPDDDAADMYLEGLARLDAGGYEQYEISNVSRPGHRSRHNVKYWQGGSWRGFGCGAHSTVDGTRWKNVAGTEEYATRIGRGDDVAVDRRVMPLTERIDEAVFTGLRMNDGLDETVFRGRWGIDVWESHADVLSLRLEAGHVWRNGGRFGLTITGMLVANDLLSELI